MEEASATVRSGLAAPLAFTVGLRAGPAQRPAAPARRAVTDAASHRRAYHPAPGGAATVGGCFALLAGAAAVTGRRRRRGGVAARRAKARKIIYEEEARGALLKGMDKLVSTVAVTLGPRGRNVLLDKEYGPPQIINDGATIAKEIELEDNVENTGCALIRQASLKTNDVAGDGTTTAAILAYAMVKKGMKQLVGGANPIQLKSGMEKAVAHVVAGIEKQAESVDVTDLKDIEQVATISAGGDVDAGKMIAEAMGKVGSDGVISLEESQTTETEVELTEGMMLEKGYVSPYLAIEAGAEPGRYQYEASNAVVLVTDQKISLAQQELVPILTLAKQSGRPMVIIADTIEKEPLATMILNKLRGIVDVCAINAPGFGDNRKAMLEDVAIVTGATVLTEDLGRTLDSVQLEDLGQCRRITIKKDSTTIVADAAQDKIEERCKQLKQQIDDTTSTYTKEQLQKRLAKLTGGVALVKVGATTETEMKDKKLRLEDAINATKAALDEGIVPGGGTMLCHQSASLQKWADDDLTEDEHKGASLVAEAMLAPLRTIAENAGRNGDLVVEKVLATSDLKQGYDALLQEFTDVRARGIVDPAKVTRSALQNAASISAMILTTECVVVDHKDSDDGGMDDDDDMDDY